MSGTWIGLGLFGVMLAAAIAGLVWWSRREALKVTIRQRLGLSGPAGGVAVRSSMIESLPWLDRALDILMLNPILTMYSGWLRRAGYRDADAPYAYFFGKIIITALCLVALYSLPSVIQPLYLHGGFPVAGIITALIIWFFMDLLLWRKVQQYRRQILGDLPFWLDLHTTLLEGGMGFDEALARIYVEKGSQRNRPIFDELQQVYRLMHLGASRSDALHSMADPLQIDALDVAVAAIIQGEIMGVGMVNILRSQADMVRNQVWEDSLTQAQRLPVELIFPMAVAILPSLFLLLIGPPLLRLIDAFTRM